MINDTCKHIQRNPPKNATAAAVQFFLPSPRTFTSIFQGLGTSQAQNARKGIVNPAWKRGVIPEIYQGEGVSKDGEISDHMKYQEILFH